MFHSLPGMSVDLFHWPFSKAVSIRDIKKKLFSLEQPLAFWELLFVFVIYQSHGILAIPWKCSMRIATGTKIFQSGFQIFYCDVQQV